MAGSVPVTSAEVCAQLTGVRLPRWGELPDLELYMDQVLALVGRYLGDYPGFDGKGPTAAMVNNYVKSGVLPPPVQKRYARLHLARLVMICVLKATLPMAHIRRLLTALGQDAQPVYDRFCELFEEANLAVTAQVREEDPTAVLLRAALLSQAEQALALRLCEGLPEK